MKSVSDAVLPEGSTVTAVPTAVALLQRWVNEGQCLGGQLYVLRAGQVIADHAIGQSAPGRAAAVTDVTRLYCAVKPVTACCLARAAERGQVSFDDAASRYLPAFSSDGREAITLRQLLSHTSGLFDYQIDPYGRPFEDIVRIVCNYKMAPQSLRRTPYYNEMTAWVVLAAVAERIYDQPFPQIVQDMLSAAVPTSHLRLTDPDPARYVPCHLLRRGLFIPVSQPPEEVLFKISNPCHGGFGSARDLGLFYSELVLCATRGGRMMSMSMARQLTRECGVVDIGMGTGRRACGLGFITHVHNDGIGGNWSSQSFGHAGYIGQYRVVHAFGDTSSGLAAAIQLFSVGAKNNWRFHQLGAAIWSDLQLTA